MNANWHGFKFFKQGKGHLEVQADIFREGETLFLRNIKPSELIKFIIGNDNSLKGFVLLNLILLNLTLFKGKILNASKVDKDFLVNSVKITPILDEYSGILALKLDMLIQISKKLQNKKTDTLFFWKYVNRCSENELTVNATETIISTTKKQLKIKSGQDLYAKKSNKSDNIFQIHANIYDLGCLPRHYQKVHVDEHDKQCKIIEKDYNKECEEYFRLFCY
uniref:Uncharacterized protein n=1 Tax=Meloidogyne hapla TaxID=6305 RepID=A0A1I8B892_MELHA